MSQVLRYTWRSTFHFVSSPPGRSPPGRLRSLHHLCQLRLRCRRQDQRPSHYYSRSRGAAMTTACNCARGKCLAASKTGDGMMSWRKMSHGARSGGSLRIPPSKRPMARTAECLHHLASCFSYCLSCGYQCLLSVLSFWMSVCRSP